MDPRVPAHVLPEETLPVPDWALSRLTETSQRALASGNQQITPDQVDMDQAALWCHQDPAFVMLQACHDRLVDVVVELLDLGLSPTAVNSVVGTTIGHSDRTTIPLAWVVAHGPETPEQRAAAERIADLLLARGADPNHVVAGSHVQGDLSAMHAACATPWLLNKLLAHGGNVQLVSSEGWSVLDHWRWCMNSAHKEAQAPGLEALTILLHHGVRRTLRSGESFLTSCWSSGILRRHIPAFIQMGFDPHERGTGQRKEAAGLSLIEHLGKKVRQGKGGALAAMLLAHHHAKVLDESLPQAQARSRPSSSRL